MSLPPRISHMLEQLNGDNRRMPATVLYSEDWMLRLILDAGENGWLPPKYMNAGDTWFSEAQLRTPFGRERGAAYESNTHADGVIGDIALDSATRSGLELSHAAERFIVFEAKMSAVLSPRTKNAPGYDQAARTVACMACTIQKAGRKPDEFEQIGFYVSAPETQIESGIFDSPMSKDSIRGRIEDRIQQFSGTARNDLTKWRDEWAWPLLDRMIRTQSLKCISWENLIDDIKDRNPREGELLHEFYQKCKQHNLAVVRTDDSGGRPIRGREYYVRAGGRDGLRVRICSVGRLNSRVYASEGRDDSFLVSNVVLETIPDHAQTPAFPDPVREKVYEWNCPGQSPVRVRVINVGDCNSRVVRADGRGDSFIVPNHQLRPLSPE